ncbi:hypothetical protein [Mycobacteroides abscessus]|uniref:hypothetical protein n=1 Tax=Mycobacteroides abscessus TaxID=36809 RepID=UPI00078D7A13|nr:hypothetical protein [Mycobacteroides abscessus]QST89844.1 hypothetical protein PROPHIGD53-3_43 [Mycobacterium phage prophiGD53-3]AMU27689.1 hypothetical protein A3N96_21675 [Mycobacteroides abscessus]MDO3363973.1 hypothetical protein [Mycobacteroides abscessus subsp. massiliense]QSM73979.1 hypothetical protein I2T84_21820 [Mycobacteroides abscessus subsp. massiliense]SKI16650.1 Uncharacterised protein [Mycobacteroides abscessus subsp. massiliense]
MKEYTLTTRHGETTVQLSDEDAEAYGDRVKPVSAKSKRAASKGANPESKTTPPEGEGAGSSGPSA